MMYLCDYCMNIYFKKNEFKNITQKKEYFYISVKKVHIQTSPGNLEVRHLAK